MVDSLMHKVLHPEAYTMRKRSGYRDDGEGESLSEETGPSGDEIYLFPSRVKGFSFRSKKWRKFPPVSQAQNV